MSAHTTQARRGIVTAEAAIGITFIVAALVFMVPYLQRAMQGNLFGVTQSVGLQYDPRNPHSERQGITMNETTESQVVWGMFGADMFKIEPVTHTPGSSLHDTRDIERRDRVLSSLPAGPVPREPAFQRSRVNASWTATDGTPTVPNTYDDLR